MPVRQKLNEGRVLVKVYTGEIEPQARKDGRMIRVPRRRFLIAAAALPLVPQMLRAQPLPPTPSCGTPTAAQTAGPFFKPRSPQKMNLRERGTQATALVVEGRVLNPRCRPVANALLDFWHADERGKYDNAGYRYRGHQYTDSDGKYRLETIVPGAYPGRTRHIHVSVRGPDRRILTTQLYFPGEAGNERDGLYRPDLTLRIKKRNALMEAEFDFVIVT